MPLTRPAAPLSITLLLMCAWPLGAAATCYTVYDQPGKVIFQATEPPVNLARELHDTVPARFGPGATMVFTLNSSGNCPGIGAGSDRFTGATEGYMAGGSRTYSADYIRSAADSRPSSAASGSFIGTGFGSPTGAFPTR